MRYSFFVGSTAFYDAHTGTAAMDAVPYPLRDGVHTGRMLARGVWDGAEESTAIYAFDVADDSAAQRIAYAMSVRTGNDCVMVTRGATDSDDYASFRSVSAYRVAVETVTDGNRTILPYADGRYPASGAGIRYTQDRMGPVVAFLVWNDASVSAVSA